MLALQRALAEEFSDAFLEKHTRNMSRNWDENKSLYEK